MNKIKIDFKSPWTMLFALCMGVALMTSLAFADEEPVGYTEDGLPIYMEDLPVEARQELLEKNMAEANALLEEAKQDDVVVKDAISKGLRQLDIEVNLKQGLKVNVLNENSLELFYSDNEIYTIVVDCVKYRWQNESAELTAVDFFNWAVVGSIKVGDRALVTRNPVKNFGNENLKESFDMNSPRIKNWDFRPRICTVKHIEKK